MMNWNSNDTKYIIKRLILYVLIACIVFFAGQKCAKATIRTENISNANNNICTNSNSPIPNVSNIWTFGTLMNYGQGEVIFNLIAQSGGGTGQTIIRDISLVSDINTYACDIGNSYTYYDNTTQQRLYTVRCPIVGNGETLQIRIQSYGAEPTCYRTGVYVTYVTENSDANSIVNGINQAIQNSMNTQTQNAITTQDLIRASNQAIANQTQAIEDQTQSINDINDWMKQDHDPLIDTEFIDVFDDLWTTQDDDVIRQFIMIPFNLFVLIYNSLTANSCSAVQLGALYNVTLSLPCINIKTLIGLSLYNTIDIIFAAGLLFGLIRFVKHVFNKIFTLSGTITDECGVEVFK